MVRASFGVAETEGDQHLSTLPAEAPKALRTGTPETNTLGHSTGGMPWNREMLRQDQGSKSGGSM